MKLTLDIGNTQIKLGVFDEFNLFYSCCLNNTDSIRKQFLYIKKYNISIAFISSVVPQLTSKFQKEIVKILEVETIIIDYKNCKINLNIPHPETVGTDRICNVAATLKLYKTPAIIVDFGTATTYDVIDKKNNFIGGIIAPGIKTSAEYLIEKAALLNDTNFVFPEKVIGKNTKENIQSGIMFGAVDQVEGMILRINNETKIKNNIILTGGFSQLLSPKLSVHHTLDMDLTLKGMIFINVSNN